MNKTTKRFLFLIQQALNELSQENKLDTYNRIQKIVLENKADGIELDEIIEKELIKKI